MGWVEAKTMFGLAPPEVTGRFVPEHHEEATVQEGVLAFDDDVTAPYFAFDLDPTEVDQAPLHP